MRSFVSLLTALSLAGCATSTDDPSTTDRGAPLATTPTTASDPCAALAAELTVLLAAAQRCHPAAANPLQCATWVPSLDGCEQPVAYAGSAETKAYLEVFEQYAAGCPLPDRPCVDPSALTVDCTQPGAADAASGRCAILDAK